VQNQLAPSSATTADHKDHSKKTHLIHRRPRIGAVGGKPVECWTHWQCPEVRAAVHHAAACLTKPVTDPSATLQPDLDHAEQKHFQFSIRCKNGAFGADQ
jgi:hypothetical protein